MLAIAILMCKATEVIDTNKFNHTGITTPLPFYLNTLTILWGAAILWGDLIQHDGCKVLTDDETIRNRLVQYDSTHISMPGESPFSRGPLAEDI